MTNKDTEAKPKEKRPRSVLPDRLSAISVCGFKCFSKETCLQFAPLTILAGANSSGKSSIMQPLLLMKQTLEAPYDPGALRLDGPNVRFTSFQQLLCMKESGCQNGFSVELQFTSDYIVKITFEKKEKKEVSMSAACARDSQIIFLRLDMK